jgi:hypothetical protein
MAKGRDCECGRTLETTISWQSYRGLRKKAEDVAVLGDYLKVEDTTAEPVDEHEEEAAVEPVDEEKQCSADPVDEEDT